MAEKYIKVAVPITGEEEASAIRKVFYPAILCLERISQSLKGDLHLT